MTLFPFGDSCVIQVCFLPHMVFPWASTPLTFGPVHSLWRKGRSGGCAVHCMVLSSTLDIYPLDTSHTRCVPCTLPVVKTQNVSRHGLLRGQTASKQVGHPEAKAGVWSVCLHAHECFTEDKVREQGGNTLEIMENTNVNWLGGLEYVQYNFHKYEYLSASHLRAWCKEAICEGLYGEKEG